jgi:hypothetical protein
MIYRFLYLLQRENHAKNYQDIYQIVRKKNFKRRIYEHPLDLQIISLCPIDKEKQCEHEVIPECNSEFQFRNDIGNSYFEGNERDIISVFTHSCSDNFPNRDEEIDMDYHWQIDDQRLATERNQRRFQNF